MKILHIYVPVFCQSDFHRFKKYKDIKKNRRNCLMSSQITNNNSWTSNSRELQPINNNNSNPPKRQGKGFKIDLGLNHGPYLPQDISAINQKSAGLLAARQVLESHTCMSKFLQSLHSKQNMMMKTVQNTLPEIQKIQNFHAQFEYLFNELSVIRQNSQKLQKQQKKLGKEFDQSYKKFINLNEEIVGMCMPILSNLHKTIRSAHEGQKNLYERSKKEIESLSKFRNTFIDKLVAFENKIMVLEQVLGVTTIEEDVIITPEE